MEGFSIRKIKWLCDDGKHFWRIVEAGGEEMIHVYCVIRKQNKCGRRYLLYRIIYLEMKNSKLIQKIFLDQ